MVAPQIQAVSPNSGAVGTTVTISGNSFGPSQGPSSVEFAGKLASPNSWSNTSIVVPVPAGATSGQVVVTVDGVNSNGSTFTVGSGGLGGIVSDSGTGNPITGASVQAFLNKKVVASAVTGSDGSYSITGLQPGSYDVEASASGYGSALTASQSTTANSTTTVNFSLSVPGSISGKVTQSDGVTAIPGATITASLDGDVLNTATADSSGNYTLSNLGAQTYDATATESGYSSQTQSNLVVSSGAATPANFSLIPESVITYAYDAHGRLVGASDSLGNTANYQYDAVGNLLSIGENPSSQISIISFWPTSGNVGASVTIDGTAFSADANQDAVSFNGTAATVTSASSTQLIVTVPSGAATGTISITAPSGTATSSQPFTLDNNAGQPTITSFTPGSGIAGAAVTITGTGFETVQNDNIVTFNLTRAAVSSATATTISTSVPPSASSGRISVRTLNGQTSSTQDFYVPFGTYAASSIGPAGRIAMNSTQALSISTTGSIGLMLFDGIAGQDISIYAKSSTFSSCTLVLIDPYGRQVDSMGCTGSSTFSNGIALAYSGTYTIGIDPKGTTGSVNVTLNGFSTVTGELEYDTPTRITTSYPGQTARYTFGGAINELISIAETSNAYPNGTMSFSIVKPDGSTFLTDSGVYGSSSKNSIILPESGTYTLVVNPGTATGGATFTLTQNITEALSFNTPLNVGSSLAGQVYDLTFSGTANEVVSLAITGGSYPGGDLGFTILKPDGTTLASGDVYNGGVGGSGGVNNEALPQTGTYTILANPGPATGSATYTLTQNITEALSFNTPSNVGSSLAGQVYDLTFSGTANEVVSLAITGDSYPHGDLGFTILNPDGTTLMSGSVYNGGVGGAGSVNNEKLPQTGTYTIVVNPGLGTGSATYTLTQNVTEALSFNTPLNVGSSLAGQVYDLTFSGTASEVVSLAITGDSYPRGDLGFTILNPDGTTLTSGSVYNGGVGGSGGVSNQTLPQTGTYTIVVNPGVGIGSATYNLTQD